VDKEQKLALQVAKEIVVKFIEVGRVSPANFAEIFPQVYQEVLRAVGSAEEPAALPVPSIAPAASPAEAKSAGRKS